MDIGSDIESLSQKRCAKSKGDEGDEQHAKQRKLCVEQTSSDGKGLLILQFGLNWKPFIKGFRFFSPFPPYSDSNENVENDEPKAAPPDHETDTEPMNSLPIEAPVLDMVNDDIYEFKDDGDDDVPLRYLNSKTRI